MPARRRTLSLAGLVLLGLALRANRLACGFPLFGDEAFLATSVLERDLERLFGHLEYDMVAPPGYLVLAWASVRALCASEWALRLPAFLAGSAALLVTARFAFRRLRASAALFATGCLAAGYYAARHTCEAKPYAFDLLCGAALVAAFAPPAAGSAPALGRAARLALACAAVWFSYPAAFIAGGVLLSRALLRDGRSARARLAELAQDGLAAGASFSAMYFAHARQQQWGAADFAGHAEQWADDFPPLSAPLSLPGWLLRQHAGYMLALPAGGSGYGSAASLVLVLAGLAAARRGPWPFLRRALLLALLLQLAAACFGLYPYGGSARTSLHLFPLFALFLGAGLSRAFLALGTRVRARRGRRAAVALLAVLALTLAARDRLQPYKNAPDQALREIVRAVATEREPGAAIALFGHLGTELGGEHGPDARTWRSLSARVRCAVRIETGRSPATTAGLVRSSALFTPAELWILAFADPRTAPFPGTELEALEAELARSGASLERRDHDLGQGQHLAVLRATRPRRAD